MSLSNLDLSAGLSLRPLSSDTSLTNCDITGLTSDTLYSGCSECEYVPSAHLAVRLSYSLRNYQLEVFMSHKVAIQKHARIFDDFFQIDEFHISHLQLDGTMC